MIEAYRVFRNSLTKTSEDDDMVLSSEMETESTPDEPYLNKSTDNNTKSPSKTSNYSRTLKRISTSKSKKSSSKKTSQKTSPKVKDAV